ncbi:MAG: chlorite dismutase family protein [Chloroflexi bacterium]|nr:chlorite dismutase family protein [Chloroflexota bacterium]
MSQESQRSRRQIVKFTFFKVDPAWRRLSAAEREESKRQFCRTVESFGDRLLVRSYSLMGARGDADFLLWQIGERLEDVQQLTTALFSTATGPYLTVPYSYLAMTRRSVYAAKDQPEAPEDRTVIRPTESKYLFVYPFVKTRAWYKLPLEERQRIMDEHIAVGRKYPSVKLNTTYSFGLDDQEFVVAFETDEPSDFLDLVMELREAESSQYTLRDTPIFTCTAMGLAETLDSLGAPGDETAAAAEGERAGPWVPVARLADVPEGESTVVYFAGDQVALFNVGGRVYALGDRCSHANGPLSEGSVEGTAVTCPWHDSQFDLATGKPLRAPAARPVAIYSVRVDNGSIFLKRKQPSGRSAASGK